MRFAFFIYFDSTMYLSDDGVLQETFGLYKISAAEGLYEGLTFKHKLIISAKSSE